MGQDADASRPLVIVVVVISSFPCCQSGNGVGWSGDGDGGGRSGDCHGCCVWRGKEGLSRLDLEEISKLSF